MNRVAKIIIPFFLSLCISYIPPLNAKDKKGDEKEGSFSIEGIEVIQNRLFQKTGRHELGVSFGILFDNPFTFYEMVPVQYTFHFRESIAIELTGAFTFSQEKGLVKSLRDVSSQNVKIETIKRYYTGNFIWSPIYGKFNIFANHIYHFDMFLTTGFGMMDNSGPVDPFAEPTEYHSVKHFVFNVGAGFKVYMNDWFVLRLDFRNFTFKEGAPFNDTANNRILTLGAAIFFPFHKSEK